MLELYGLTWRIEGRLRIVKSGCYARLPGHRDDKQPERTADHQDSDRPEAGGHGNVRTEDSGTATQCIGRPCRDNGPRGLHQRTPESSAEIHKTPSDNPGATLTVMPVIRSYLNRKSNQPPGHKTLW